MKCKSELASQQIFNPVRVEIVLESAQDLKEFAAIVNAPQLSDCFPNLDLRKVLATINTGQMGMIDGFAKEHYKVQNLFKE